VVQGQAAAKAVYEDLVAASTCPPVPLPRIPTSLSPAWATPWPAPVGRPVQEARLAVLQFFLGTERDVPDAGRAALHGISLSFEGAQVSLLLLRLVTGGPRRPSPLPSRNCGKA